ncbi:MAG: alpha/beta hydrolase [Ignavibacteria bacterium]|jgi:pimeloyl-ACP methyl ester carboxylesterase
MKSQNLNSDVQSGIVQSNGIDLYYEKSGNGPVLILIEGLGAAIYLWDKQIPELSKHFTVIAYDNRGIGKSTKPPGPYSITMMADDLSGLMDGLNISKAHILGASMGGLIAQEFALRYPDKVDKLILCATTAGGIDHVPMSQEVLQLVLKTDGDPIELLKKKLALVYTEPFLKDSENLDHLIKMRLENPYDPETYQAQAMAAAVFDRSNEVKNIRATTLILAASNDLLMPVENAYNLNKKITNSKLKIQEGYGHQFFIENYTEFNKDVIEFLLD